MTRGPVREMVICRECGGEAQGGEVLPLQTATGYRLVHRCWACVMAEADPPCCQRAHERGYRRGYRDGYTYALWDLGGVTRVTDHLWAQVETFLHTELAPWVRRAAKKPWQALRREGGPRLRLKGQKRTRHGSEAQAS